MTTRIFPSIYVSQLHNIDMADGITKRRKTSTVRIYEDTKEWLVQKAIDRAAKEKRRVTELEVGEEIFQKEIRKSKRA